MKRMLQERIQELENKVETYENTFSSFGRVVKKATRYINCQLETACKECNVETNSSKNSRTTSSKKCRDKKKNGK